MAMGISATAWIAIATAASVAVTYDQGQKARSAQEQAQRLAEESARKQAAAADIAMNRANQKKPNINASLAAAQAAGQGGMSGTMLTGPQGVTGGLPLGGNTLLGS